MIDTMVHIAVYLLMPPLLFGVINKTKAKFAGRVGAPFLQPYYDLLKLFRKDIVLSTTTTWVFAAGPAVTLTAVVIAGLFMPLGNSQALISFTGDFILFAYLFGLARFFTTSAALDTGSAFEGMGAAREVTFATLTEPGLFFAFLVFVKLSGALTLDGMLRLGRVPGLPAESAAPLVMVVIGLFIILLAENSRIPVDDPNTHLELTMIHEVMVLDHSGPLFGIIQYAASLKFFILSSMLLNIMIPIYTGRPWLDWLVYIAGVLLLSVAVGVTESAMARLRMSRVPLILIAAILLCGSAFILFVR